MTEELEQQGQTMRNVELKNTDLMEKNKMLEKTIKDLEWKLHEQEAVKNARSPPAPFLSISMIFHVNCLRLESKN